MNPVVPILLVFGGVLVYSMLKTAKTAVNLQYTVTRFSIYNFATSGALVFRVRVRFTNGEPTPLHINFFDLQAYIKPTYTTQADGKPNIISKGSLIASTSDTNGFVIAPNSFTEHDFYINVRWSDIGKYFVTNIADIISIISSSNSIRDFARRMAGTPILIYGTVKAENINIPLTTIVQLQNDMA